MRSTFAPFGAVLAERSDADHISPHVSLTEEKGELEYVQLFRRQH